MSGDVGEAGVGGAFAGRVVVVTGGGTGIGRAIAQAFHAEGARVVVASRNPDNLKKAAQVIAARSAGSEGGADAFDRLMPLRVDVRVPESARAAARQIVAAWGGVDVLVNNAGVTGPNPIDGGAEAEADADADARWMDIIATNLHGPWLMTRAILPHMSRGGRIVNICSVLGKFGEPGFTAYCASKHGVVGFTRALAAEIAPRGITVNAICPGWVDTAMTDARMAQNATRLGVTQEEARAAALARVPLGRMIRPAEIAPLALYIASPAAEALTGQAINIEGGATTW